ncbi:hypothetical protein PQD71_gp178 [Kosakonia phage Kc263]|uniref:Uncharacterized protein n=1 Tax=Kosakonia phage Kc263 TaxID=2863194 RepID=A0AAE7WFG3_9CAUD|nr:hypothetical protein PQD71_gp178 [Kosakonia phage Kc263]QYN80148.1 hypothetical protein [Kosakonia phage Kc263]
MLTHFITWASDYTGYGVAAFNMLLLQIFFMVLCGILGTLGITLLYNRYHSDTYWIKGDTLRLFKSSVLILVLGAVVIAVSIIFNLEMK